MRALGGGGLTEKRQDIGAIETYVHPRETLCLYPDGHPFVHYPHEIPLQEMWDVPGGLEGYMSEERLYAPQMIACLLKLLSISRLDEAFGQHTQTTRHPQPHPLSPKRNQTMPPRPSAKRPASETFASSSKKTRFLDPDEDPANFSEQVESNLEDDPRTRRKGRVRTEGYESDSSDDGEGVVNSRKPINDAEDDDDDMFASVAAEEKKPVENVKKDKNKFLRLGDIEGQEFGGSGLGDGSESSDSDEPEDEDDAERKKAGMGYELSSFNMREEMEEGKFSADGSYVRVFDPHAVHDRWLEDTDEKAMKKARRVRKQREKQEREKQEAEEKELQDMGGKVAVEMQLLTKFKKGETVLEVLQRLGAKKHKGWGSPYAARTFAFSPLFVL